MMSNESAEATAIGRVWGFLLITFAISWPIWIASGALGRDAYAHCDFNWLVAQVGTFGPSLSALVIIGTGQRALQRNRLRILSAVVVPLAIPGILIALNAPRNPTEMALFPAIATVFVAALIIGFFLWLRGPETHRGSRRREPKHRALWIILAIVFFPALFLLAWIGANLRGGEWQIMVLQDHPQTFGWVILESFAHNLLLGGSLGEEIGWRGFLLPNLLKRHGPLAASALLGLIWGLWHVPVDLSGGFLLEGPGAVLIRIIWAIPLAIIFTWFYLHSNGDLVVAFFLHTSINVMTDLGFSRLQQTMLFFFVLAVLAATTVATLLWRVQQPTNPNTQERRG